MDQQTNFSHCGSCAVISAFHWGTVPQCSTVFPVSTHTALELENVSIQQYRFGCSLDYVCSSISRLPLTLSPRNLSYLPTSSQQCVLRERMSARLIVNLTASQMQSVCANRSIVKLRKIEAGGLYPDATLKQSPSCVVY